ncbi:MAG: hypothetical protein FWG61_02625 [Firmicutes bacterium]|nr:hypothetical protein [Bacillota bacterium]
MKKNWLIKVVLAFLLILMLSAIALAEDTYNADSLNRLGLFLGTTNGYDLDIPCDRLMGAVLLTRFLGLETQALTADYLHPFIDVQGTYADKYIGFLYASQLIQGQSEDIYGKNTMTANEFATLMLRSLGYQDNYDFTWNNALEEMLELGIISWEELDALNHTSFLRQDAVLLCYKVLYALPKYEDKPLIYKLLWEDVFTVEQLSDTKDGALMIAADTPGYIADETMVFSLEDAKKLIMLAIKNAQYITELKIPGFTPEELFSINDSVLGEYRSYGEIWQDPEKNIEINGDVFTFEAWVYDAYKMENYYKDPQRYQKHPHFTRPTNIDFSLLELDVFKENEAVLQLLNYQFINTWVNKMNEILSACLDEGMSEREKVKALHDYLILNTTYDSSFEEGWEGLPHNPGTVFIENRGVCDAYAAAFKIMLNAAGIECIVVPGEAYGEGHAWNQVKIDDKWYNIDVTWDDPDNGSRINYDYYCISDSKMYKDHKVDEGFEPYICSSSLKPNR